MSRENRTTDDPCRCGHYRLDGNPAEGLLDGIAAVTILGVIGALIALAVTW